MNGQRVADPAAADVEVDARLAAAAEAWAAGYVAHAEALVATAERFARVRREEADLRGGRST